MDILLGSIEKAIADTKETYYEVLQNADQNWYEGENDPKPFIKYMLGIILSCYREFEARIVLAEKTGKKSKAYDVVKTYSENTLGKFSKHDALVACPSLGSSSVESALKKLVDEGAMIIQQDILAFLWNMGEVQIDEFEVFEGKEQNKIEKP